MRINFVAPLITLFPLVIGYVQFGEQSGDLEVDETDAHPPGVHAWVALTDYALNKTFCGASILDETRALTLARCAYGRSSWGINVVVYPYSGQLETVYAVKSIIFPDEHKIGDDDVAIITIVQKFHLSQLILPVCLPYRHAGDTFVGKISWSLAWNRIRSTTGFHDDILYRKDLMVMSNFECGNRVDDLNRRTMCNDLSLQRSDFFLGGEPIYWTCPKTGIILQIGIILSKVNEGVGMISMLRIGGFLHWIAKHADAGKFFLSSPIIR